MWFVKRTPRHFYVYAGVLGLAALSLLAYESLLSPIEAIPAALVLLAFVLAHLPVRLSPLISFQGAYPIMFFLVYEFRSPWFYIPAIAIDAYIAWRDLPEHEKHLVFFSAVRMAFICAILVFANSYFVAQGVLLSGAAAGHALSLLALALALILFNWISLAVFGTYRLGDYILRTGIIYDFARYLIFSMFAFLLTISYEISLETGMPISFATAITLILALQLVMFAWQRSEDRTRSIKRLLVSLIDWRDRYADTRSMDNLKLSLAFARFLKWSPLQIDVIRSAGLLQDVGKVVVSDGILHKQERLTAAEFDIMKKHINFAADTLSTIEGFGEVARAVREHHERWDGKGYPAGIHGEDICIPGRLLMITDSFLAMVSARPFRPGMAREKALRIIEGELGTQFDPSLGKDFLRFMQEGAEPLDALIFYPPRA